jgi:TolB protein
MRSSPIRLNPPIPSPSVSRLAAAILALAIAGCAGVTPSVSVTSGPAVTATIVPTSKPTPSVAPVQGQIVFEHHVPPNGYRQIYIEQADGSTMRQLVTSAFDDFRPALSPDGMTVLFMRIGDGGDKVYLVDVDGTNVRLFPGCTGDCSREPQGDAWSPDGKRLAYVRLSEDGVALVIANVNGSGTPREVTKTLYTSHLGDGRPDWSPDGTRLAFARSDETVTPIRSAIFTVKTDGTDLVQVTPWGLGATEPAWSPDGSLIAFDSPTQWEGMPGADQNIFTIRPDGSGLQQLTSGLASFPDDTHGTFDPCWSPDGGQIIFTHIPSTNGLADLFVVNADGSDLHVLEKATVLNEGHADWGISPAR